MSDYSDSGAIVAAALLAGFLGFLFFVAYYVLSSIFLGKIFQKAGV